MDFKLAPLSMRRDIALLGVMNRSANGEGPAHLREHFTRRQGSLQLVDTYAHQRMSLLLPGSMWELVRVYANLGGTLECGSMKDFQMHLRERAKSVVCKRLQPAWGTLYSPR